MTDAPDPDVPEPSATKLVPTSTPEPNPRPPMNEIASQNPIVTNTSPELSLWHWLTEPHESQWLLPATGAWILGLDWLLFAQNTATLYVATPILVVAGFVGGTLGTYLFQTRYADDRGARAWVKSLLAGIVVGVPFPLAGTFVGGWILFNSGLASVRDRLLRKKK